MNTADQSSLKAALIQSGFISSDAAAPEMTQLERPWFIGLLVGVSGWLAGIFLTLLAGFLFGPETAVGWAVASAIGFAAAFALYRIDGESAFFDQLALALWIAAQCAFVVAASEMTKEWAVIAGSVALMQAALAFFTPNRLARLIATFFACIAWGLTLRFGFWDEEFFSERKSAAPLPAVLTSFATWVPVILFVVVLVKKEQHWLAEGRQKLFRPMLSGLLLGLSFGSVATHPEFGLPAWNESNVFDNWLALLPLLSAAYACIALYCAFKLRHRGLMGAAIVGALWHVAQFYYVIGLSLLLKSAIMLIVGAALLAAAFALEKSCAKEAP